MSPKRIFLCLLTTLFATASFAQAAASSNCGQDGRVPVGERPYSFAEHAASQEERAVESKKITGKEISEDNDALPSQQMQEASMAVRAEMPQDRPVPKNMARELLETSHPGAFYKPFSVSRLGDTVELHDGSVWSISFDDRIHTLNWLASDDLVIIPNTDWFSVYTYRLANQQTGASVKANLYLGPINRGFYTYWIVAIDYFNSQICLNDGSIWSMSPIDVNIINKWAVNDTVIVGVNNGGFAAIRPNILINVNMNNYGMGNCLFY